MSSQIADLLEGAGQGHWILPLPDEPNPVALARAVASICGAPQRVSDPVADRFRSLIGDPEHLVFVIADGFGMNFVDNLDQNSFSRSNLALESRAVFPTSTGPNLFTYGRALWPGQHGSIGWYVHLPELGERVTLFPWTRTRDGKSLSDLGISGEQVYPGTPEVRRFERDSVNFIPSLFSGSVATRALHGAETIVGYEGLDSAVDLVVERVTAASAPTYSHIFWPEVDRAAHEFGTDHPNTLREVEYLDSELGRLSRSLPESARIVLTADHGHLNFGDGQKFIVERTDPLRLMLIDEPSGDERSLFFHVIEGRDNSFATEFEQRFGDHFVLFATGDLLETKLLGPDGISDFTTPRLGSFTAIARNDAGMKFLAHESDSEITLVSQHGGLSPEEMLVPVIIA